MSSFAPTLRMELTTREVESFGSNLDLRLRSGYEISSDGGNDRKIQIDRLTVVETGEIIERFEAKIASTFQKDGVNHIQTMAGDIIPLRVYYPVDR